jgi:Glycosyl hydrolases family 16
MVSRDAFSFKFGRVEVNAKMPAGDWLWPAIWFMPKNSEYGTWPASGEIDLTETRGNRDLSINGGQIGTQQTGATLHFGPKWPFDAWGAAHKTRNNPQGYDRAFHKYQMEWSPREYSRNGGGSIGFNEKNSLQRVSNSPSTISTWSPFRWAEGFGNAVSSSNIMCLTLGNAAP